MPGDRANIIWIYCDELRTDALGCYGHPQLKLHTPAIDGLAAEGVRFSNHFCNSPVCVASRTCALTAMHPEHTGVYNNEGAWPSFQLPRRLETFPRVLAKNGYQTANFGKIHLPRQLGPESEDPNSRVFQHHDGEGGQMAIWNHLPQDEIRLIRTPGGSINGGVFPEGYSYPPEAVVTNALRWMERTDAPFFARISFLQPHTPVLPPARFLSLYEDQKLDLPSPLPDTVSDYERRVAQVHGLEQMAPDDLHAARIHYYALVSWIDEQVNRILTFLRRRGTLERTLIIFNADHGNPLGETGAFGKQTFTPSVHRVPLIFRNPESVDSGQVRDDLSESLDLARTIFGFANIAPPSSFQGRDLFRDPAPEAIYSTIGFGNSDSRMGPNGGRGTWFNGRGWPRRSCIRTHNFRLDKNIRVDGHAPAAEDEDVFLCDLRKDPSEMRNVAREHAYQETLHRLNRKLGEHTKNPVEVPPSALVRHRPSAD